MLQIVKEVSRKVTHPQTGNAVTRNATVTFNAVDPSNEDWLEDALLIAGGNTSLVAKVFNFGLWRFIQQTQTNELGKVDELSKNISRAIAGLVNSGQFTETEAKTFIMASPKVASAMTDAKFEQFVTVAVESVDAERYPDVTKVDSEEESKDEAPVA
jgi:polyhydroxyalkanoate synthesis regulator phasin